MTEDWIGKPIARREDHSRITGAARYTADIRERNSAHLAVLRSRYAHARIREISTGSVEALEGVLAVYTAEDVKQSGVPGRCPEPTALPTADGGASARTIHTPLRLPPRPILPTDRTRYVGEPLAVVLATDPYTAHDALSQIEVDYDRLEAVCSPDDALSQDAVQIHGEIDDNLAFDWRSGHPDATRKAIEAAPHTVRVELDQQRLIPNAIEPRAAVASFDPSSETLTVRRPSQGSHSQRRYLSTALGLSVDQIRVVTPTVGGSFGNKSKAYPAELLVAWCALQHQRPVRWEATRSEMYTSGAHGRGHQTTGELAFDDTGALLGFRVEGLANMGAFPLGPAASIHTSSFTSVLSGQYEIPEIYCRIRGVYTNTAPISSYRATSRPRAILVLERLIEKAGRRLDTDPTEIRRQNFIPADAFPYETPLEATYDSGDYVKTLERAKALVEYEQIRDRQSAWRDEGRYLGIGIACALDQAGSNRVEHHRLEVDSSGEIRAVCGTLDTGQGHRTAFAQILAEKLAVPIDRITIHQGDTQDLARGTGTSGSRSAIVADNHLSECADRLIEKGRRITAHRFETPVEGIAYEGGRFFHRNRPDRNIGFASLAEFAPRSDELPAELDSGLSVTLSKTGTTTYPFGTHIAVVEVDPESGDIDLRRYVAVDDCGTQINPELVENQIYGGIVQGVGQALFEQAIFDERGTLRTGSMQDYVLPKAHQLPNIELETTSTPSPRTAHGVKGIGESGPTAAPAAIANAVVDGLSPLNVEDVQLPITSEQIWRAVQSR